MKRLPPLRRCNNFFIVGSWLCCVDKWARMEGTTCKLDITIGKIDKTIERMDDRPAEQGEILETIAEGQERIAQEQEDSGKNFSGAMKYPGDLIVAVGE